MGDYEFWSFFMILMFSGWIATTWIRAKHGYPVENSWWGETGHPDHAGKRGGQSETDRKKIEMLEERIRILEKIVTDNYKSSALSEEIEKLKEAGNEQ
jgi:hypothetical protein